MPPTVSGGLDPAVVDDLLTASVDPTAMDTIHWPGLARRLQVRVIADLWYDPAAGSLVIVLEGGQSLLVSADWEGCQVTYRSTPLSGCFDRPLPSPK